MRPQEYGILFAAEEGFWWYRGMRRITETLLDRFQVPAGFCLDLGCGTGKNLEQLEGRGFCLGIEPAAEAMPFLARRGLGTVAQARAERLPFPDQSFDLLTAFDVLGYLADDEQGLAEAWRVLKPGGLALIRAAAFPALFGNHERVQNAYRRYSRADLLRKLAAAGFQLRFFSYANSLLFPAIALFRLGRRVVSSQRQEPQSDFRFSPAGLGGLFELCLQAEALWLRSGRLPVGCSLLALAQKGSGG